MSLDSCGLEHEASVKQEGWEPVKQEPSEAAAAGLYASHEVKGELVLGPTTLQPPDAAFATTVFGDNGEHTRWPPGDLPQPQVTTESKQYECEICLKQFSYTSHLLIHKKIHNGEEPCELDVCPKLVSSKSPVTRNKSVDVKKKSFKCDVCEKQFSENRYLRVRRVRIRACSVRLERLSPAEDKRAHSTILGASVERQTNDGIKPKGPPEASSASDLYFCDACGARFERRAQLLRHARGHIHASLPAERRLHTALSGLRDHSSIYSPSPVGGTEAERTGPPPAEERGRPAGGPRPGARRPDQLRIRACSVRLERLSPAEDKRAHSTILGASVERQTNDGIKPKGPPEASSASDLYFCDACGARFERRAQLLRHARGHIHASLPAERRLHTALSELREHSSIYSPSPVGGAEAERTGPPPAEERGRPAGGPRPGARRPDQLRLRACSVRLERLSPAEDKRAHSTILGASVERQTNHYGTKPKGPPEAGAASELYSCDACGAQFAWKQNLIRHIKKYCQRCNLFVRKNISEKPYKCEICLKRFHHQSNLSRHKDIHTGEKRYKCKICLKHFSRKSYLIKHNIFFHNGEKPYKCEICSKLFLESNDLMVHKHIHTSKNKCEICLKCFPCKSDLLRHKYVHADEKPYKCEICLKQFSQSGHLNNHRRLHTGKKPYNHEIRLKEFMSKRKLLEHKSTVEHISSSISFQVHEDRAEKPLKCKICLKRFSRKKNLQVHNRIHTSEKPYKCEICLKQFTRTDHLINHKLIHGEKLYKCDICLKQFSQKHILQVHKLIHTGEKPYKCDICLKQFSQNHSLLVHKRIHSGEKPYKCDICLKLFAHNSNLQVHKLIHTGEKPYKCEICFKQFTQSCNLNRHKCIIKLLCASIAHLLSRHETI